MSRESMAPAMRVGALDGLRGFAAVVVALWHALMTTPLLDGVPRLLGSTEIDDPNPAPGTLAWWLLDTPLRLFTMGINAVSVFFVLSGVVLALPVFRGKVLDLWNYYPRRFLRLWLPSAASVLLAAAIILLTRQNPANAQSAWGTEFSHESVDLGGVVSELFLITGRHPYNNPLWSLKWEMLFSLMLPIVLLLALRLRRGWWVAIVLLSAASGAGEALEVPGLQYVPMFLVGALIARIAVHREGTPPAWAGWVSVLVGGVMIGAPDMWRSVFGGDMQGPVGHALGGFVVLGAALVAHGLMLPGFAGTVFGSAPLRFLGRISFSLYLVHVPILSAGVHVFGDAWSALLVTIPLAFLVAWAFTRWIEEPSARLARRAGAASTATMQRVASHSH